MSIHQHTIILANRLDDLARRLEAISLAVCDGAPDVLGALGQDISGPSTRSCAERALSALTACEELVTHLRNELFDPSEVLPGQETSPPVPLFVPDGIRITASGFQPDWGTTSNSVTR